MSIPEEAIEAAVAAMSKFAPGNDVARRADARTALEAAMPAIREAIAQEIEARSGGDYAGPDRDPLAHVAAIIRAMP